MKLLIVLLVVLLSAAIDKLSPGLATALFVLYSALNGVAPRSTIFPVLIHESCG